MDAASYKKKLSADYRFHLRLQYMWRFHLKGRLAAGQYLSLLIC